MHSSEGVSDAIGRLGTALFLVGTVIQLSSTQEILKFPDAKNSGTADSIQTTPHLIITDTANLSRNIEYTNLTQDTPYLIKINEPRRTVGKGIAGVGYAGIFVGAAAHLKRMFFSSKKSSPLPPTP